MKLIRMYMSYKECMFFYHEGYSYKYDDSGIEPWREYASNLVWLKANPRHKPMSNPT